MKPFTVYDAAGQILRRGNCQDGTLSLQAQVGESVFEGSYNGRTHWFDSDVPTTRPTLPLPASHSIAVSTDWTITPVPDGTEVFTDGELVGTVASGELIISFPEAGTWQLELRPPFPYRDATSEVTVT